MTRRSGEHAVDLGQPLDTLQVVRAIRWSSDATPDEMIAAMHATADSDVRASWPELDEREITDLRAQCRAMTKSRLRAWNSRERTPTWLEVRGLISGLHHVVE